MPDLSGGLALFGQEVVNGLELGFDYATDGSMIVGNLALNIGDHGSLMLGLIFVAIVILFPQGTWQRFVQKSVND